jgi:hypothetical protein
LVNLLRNAMDAMDAGKTERRSIVVVARRKSSRVVEISVADSGPGGAAEVTDTIQLFTVVGKCGVGALHHYFDCVVAAPQRRVRPIIGNIVRRVEFLDRIELAVFQTSNKRRTIALLRSTGIDSPSGYLTVFCYSAHRPRL